MFLEYIIFCNLSLVKSGCHFVDSRRGRSLQKGLMAMEDYCTLQYA